jgi:lysyl-tRNA synthetase class 2
VFRNEGISTRHNPEFTMLEVYQAYADYHDMMDLTESLVVNAAEKVVGSTHILYQGEAIDLTPPWRRATMHELVTDQTGVDLQTFTHVDQAKAALRHLQIPGVGEATSLGAVLVKAFEHCCEDHLRQPTFVLDYPVEVSPLTKPHRYKAGLVERFELYIVGRETANAYSELTDPVDQRQRFEQQAALKAAGDEEAHWLDEDFLTAIEHGLPPTGGMGMGIDRLAMLLLDAPSIRDVIAFPLLKPEG